VNIEQANGFYPDIITHRGYQDSTVRATEWTTHLTGADFVTHFELPSSRTKHRGKPDFQSIANDFDHDGDFRGLRALAWQSGQEIITE